MISLQESLSPVKQGDVKAGTGVTLPKKEASQWCDVGIMKGTTCVVSYYHLTSDIAHGNGEVNTHTLHTVDLTLFTAAVCLSPHSQEVYC